MKKQYLHLSAYSCDQCAGPVVAGVIAVRENEISKETDVREVGAICLACGHRQSKATEPGFTRSFAPTRWESVNVLTTTLAPTTLH
ncbi:MAG: hypothetical protein ABR908_09095 [Terriglobales bacterium]